MHSDVTNRPEKVERKFSLHREVICLVISADEILVAVHARQVSRSRENRVNALIPRRREDLRETRMQLTHIGVWIWRDQIELDLSGISLHRGDSHVFLVRRQ